MRATVLAVAVLVGACGSDSVDAEWDGVYQATWTCEGECPSAWIGVDPARLHGFYGFAEGDGHVALCEGPTVSPLTPEDGVVTMPSANVGERDPVTFDLTGDGVTVVQSFRLEDGVMTSEVTLTRESDGAVSVWSATFERVGDPGFMGCGG